MVGSIRPSSRFLGEKMLENIDFIRSKSLIELGPGCGVFTDMIIDRMAPDASFGTLAGLCLVAGFLTILCGIAVIRMKD